MSMQVNPKPIKKNVFLNNGSGDVRTGEIPNSDHNTNQSDVISNFISSVIQSYKQQCCQALY